MIILKNKVIYYIMLVVKKKYMFLLVDYFIYVNLKLKAKMEVIKIRKISKKIRKIN
jgi:hypothetical protein